MCQRQCACATANYTMQGYVWLCGAVDYFPKPQQPKLYHSNERHTPCRLKNTTSVAIANTTVLILHYCEMEIEGNDCPKRK
jgi:hypothetical protein